MYVSDQGGHAMIFFLLLLVFSAQQVILAKKAPAFGKDELTAMPVQYRLNMRLIEALPIRSRVKFKLNELAVRLKTLASTIFDAKVLLRFCGQMNKYFTFNEYLVNVYQVEYACPWAEVIAYKNLDRSVFRNPLPEIITSASLESNPEIKAEIQSLVANVTKIFKPWNVSPRVHLTKMESFLDKHVVAEVQRQLHAEIDRQTGHSISKNLPEFLPFIECNVSDPNLSWKSFHEVRHAFPIYVELPKMTFKLKAV